MRAVAAAAGILAAAVVVAWTSVCVLPAGEAAVVTQFGKPVAVWTEPGLRWKWPGGMQRANRIDVRIDSFDVPPVQMLLGDKNPVVAVAYVAWRVKDPLTFHQSVAHPEAARQKLADMVASALGRLMADHTLEQIVNPDPERVKLGEIERAATAQATGPAEEKYGVEVVRVGFRRLTYPAIVAESVHNRMRAERDKEARKYRAEGREEAAKIEAAADKEVSGILAKAYRRAETIRGEGDRKAGRIYAEAYGKDPEFYEFLRSLELYREALRGRATLVLSTRGELFRHLGGAVSNEEGGRP